MIASCNKCRVLLSFVVISATGLCLGTSCIPEKGADSNSTFTPVKIDAPVDASKDTPQVPTDAQYTIMCRSFMEEDHVRDARLAQQQLHDTTPMKKWYVVHSADHSTLYYGYYRCIDPRDPKDGAEGKRAIEDLNAIRAMASTDGSRVFPESLLVGVVAPDPQANPAWDITRAPGVWSIEIGSFTTADRKQKAVDAVRDARSQGAEAYYYHGETASSVCIGCWPEESAIEVTPQQQNVDPNLPVVVANTPLSPEYEKQLGAHGVQAAAPHVDIVDLTLSAALAKWPEHSVNGWNRVVKDPNTGVETIVERSFLFRIPHNNSLDTITDVAPPTPAPKPTQKTEPAPGQLRSLPE